VFFHPDLHPRMDDGAKRLRQDERRSAAIDLFDGQSARAVGGARVERNQRVDAQQQIDALVERNRRVQRLVERTVDVVLAVDLDWWKQSRQRARRLDGARYRNMVSSICAERDRSAAI